MKINLSQISQTDEFRQKLEPSAYNNQKIYKTYFGY